MEPVTGSAGALIVIVLGNSVDLVNYSLMHMGFYWIIPPENFGVVPLFSVVIIG